MNPENFDEGDTICASDVYSRLPKLRERGKESQDGDNVAVDSPRFPADTTMHKTYGDESDHKCCPKCGMCIDCNDCKCEKELKC